MIHNIRLVAIDFGGINVVLQDKRKLHYSMYSLADCRQLSKSPSNQLTTCSEIARHPKFVSTTQEKAAFWTRCSTGQNSLKNTYLLDFDMYHHEV